MFSMLFPCVIFKEGNWSYFQLWVKWFITVKQGIFAYREISCTHVILYYRVLLFQCNSIRAEPQRNRWRIPNLFQGSSTARPPVRGQDGELPKHCVGAIVGIMKNGIPLYYGHNVNAAQK